MEALGIFMIVGGAFVAFLFNLNAEYGDKCAATIRNVFMAIAIAGVMLFIVGIYRFWKMPLYEYKINAHYIDGSTRTLMFESKYDPKIEACRGTYWLEYAGYNELGVVRFEIINKIEKKDD